MGRRREREAAREASEHTAREGESADGERGRVSRQRERASEQTASFINYFAK